MLELFVFGTLWFWLFVGAMFVVLVALTENEKPGWALTAILGSALLINIANGGGALLWMAHHPFSVIGIVVSYFVFGVLNARYKWGKLVYKMRQELNDEVSSFLKSHDLEGTAIPADLENKWVEWLHRNDYSRRVGKDYDCSKKPLLKQHKAQIITWMAYWPWSVFWTLLNDPIRWAFEEVYTGIAKWFQSVADEAFKDAPLSGKDKKPE